MMIGTLSLFSFLVGVSVYAGDVLSLDYKSCEMISDDLANEIGKKYPDRAVTIEVSEDGENGSIAKYE